VDQARAYDDLLYQQAIRSHSIESAEMENLRALSVRILAADPKAYIEALLELSPLSELSSLGSNLHFTVHGPQLLECCLKVNGAQVIPAEVKSLTATEKLSVKPMARVRFHEIYQDYICGCVLRVAREVFALLPVNTILTTAIADVADPFTGVTREQPVLSVAISRASLNNLDFDYLDASDTVDALLHRGDFRASRKTGAFAPIVPLTPADVPASSPGPVDEETLLNRTRALRQQINAELGQIDSSLATPIETIEQLL
jgi:hypothetical protein